MVFFYAITRAIFSHFQKQNAAKVLRVKINATKKLKQFLNLSKYFSSLVALELVSARIARSRNFYNYRFWKSPGIENAFVCKAMLIFDLCTYFNPIIRLTI